MRSNGSDGEGSVSGPLAGSTDGGVDELEARRLRAALQARVFGREVEPVRVGRYVLEEPIGEGAMGTVYRAHDPQLDRHVAIKVLRHVPGGPADGVERLRREARALATLNHPHVLAIHEVGVSEGVLFMAVEHVDGSDLATYCAEHPVGTRARAERVLELAFQAAEGLVAAHRAGIVHRDLKPSNVLVDADGRLRLADFGLARLPSESRSTTTEEVSLEPTQDDRLTRTGAVVGTPAFMAPEQLEGRSDAKSDQFSWCATFYEALYGVRALPDRSSLGDLGSTRLAPPPRSHGVPPWVLPVLRRGLASDPDDRFGDMGALVDALHRGRARRRRGVLGTSLAILGLGSWVVVSSGAREPCVEPRELVASVWGDDARERVRAGLSAEGMPLGEQTWERVDARLGQRVERWAEASTGACRASRDRDPEVAAAARSRGRCLDAARRTLDLSIDMIAELPPESVHLAVDMIHGIGDLTDCRAPSTGRADAEDALELAGTLARARLLSRSARWDAAQERLAGILEGLGAHEQPRIRALAHLELAAISFSRGDHEAEREHLERALDAAVFADDDELLGRAWLQGTSDDHSLELRRFALRRVEAMAARGLLSPRLRARTSWRHGALLASQGDDAGAVDRLAEAKDLLVSVEDVDPELAVAVEGDLAESLLISGRARDALAAGRRGIELAAELYGPDHPVTATLQARVAQIALFSQEAELGLQLADSAVATLDGGPVVRPSQLSFAHDRRAAALSRLGRHEEALAALRRSVEIVTQAYGSRDRRVLSRRLTLARVLFERGQSPAALAEVRAVLDGWSHDGDGTDEQARARMLLAEILTELGRCEDALPELTRADADLQAWLGEDSLVRLQHEQTVGRVLAACDRHEAAGARLGAALARAEELKDGPWQVRLHYELAHAMRRAGNEAAAVTHARQALELAADDPAAIEELRAFLAASPASGDPP